MARRLFDVIRAAVQAIGKSKIRVSKSQIAFRRTRGFAKVWIPTRYPGGPTPPLVLTIGLLRRDGSARWKEVVGPYPGRFTHHLEMRNAAGIDSEVQRWLVEAWQAVR